jgi:maleate isomerase
LDEGLKPAVSCNLALAWATAQARAWDNLDGKTFDSWRNAFHWRGRVNGSVGS